MRLLLIWSLLILCVDKQSSSLVHTDMFILPRVFHFSNSAPLTLWFLYCWLLQCCPDQALASLMHFLLWQHRSSCIECSRSSSRCISICIYESCYWSQQDGPKDFSDVLTHVLLIRSVNECFPFAHAFDAGGRPRLNTSCSAYLVFEFLSAAVRGTHSQTQYLEIRIKKVQFRLIWYQNISAFGEAQCSLRLFNQKKKNNVKRSSLLYFNKPQPKKIRFQEIMGYLSSL